MEDELISKNKLLADLEIDKALSISHEREGVERAIKIVKRQKPVKTIHDNKQKSLEEF